MDPREIKVVEAAIRVISRYGVKRTTMNDIAEEAGVVRQTLYTIFPNKDEMLRGAIRHLSARAVAEVEAGWKTAGSLAEKLDIVFEQMVIRPYDIIHASPEADDMISGFNAAAKAELAQASQSYRRLIADALAPYGPALTERGLNVASFADFVQRTAYSFKQGAEDRAHLAALLSDLKAAVLFTVGERR